VCCKSCPINLRRTQSLPVSVGSVWQLQLLWQTLGVRHWFLPKLSVAVVVGLCPVPKELVCQVFRPSESFFQSCDCPCSSCFVLSMLQEPSHQPTMVPIATFFCWQCFGNHNYFDGLWEWGIGSHPSCLLLLLSDCVLSWRNWCANCLRLVNPSIVTAIVLFSFSFVQYDATAIPTSYDRPTCLQNGGTNVTVFRMLWTIWLHFWWRNCSSEVIGGERRQSNVWDRLSLGDIGPIETNNVEYR